MAFSQQALYGVHVKQRKHQGNFDVQNVVGVCKGPTFHFRFVEAVEFSHIPAPPKNHHCHDSEHGEDFKKADDDGVGIAQEGREKSMGAEQAVNDDFEHLNIDDQKSGIDDEVKQSCHWSSLHFALTKGYAQHIRASSTGIVASILCFAKMNIS